MTRRRLVPLLLLGLLAAPLAAEGQQAGKVWRVGVLVPGVSAGSGEYIEVFRGGLRELGWIEGRNLVLDVRYADNRYDRLPALAAELVALKPDVIFAAAAPAIRAVTQATRTIPIVFETLGDALASGLVSNLARPGGNVTGISGFAPELSAKRLQLIREIVPRAARIAVLANLANPGTPAVVRVTEAAARHMQIQLYVVDVREATGLDGGFDRMARQEVEALVVVSDSMLFGQRRRIIELAARHRLPAVYELRLFPDDGGLLSYGPGRVERFQRAAVYVDRILRGAKPADLPVEQPTKFELVINLKTAKALGLTIPQSLLLRADQVIE
jgi:putative ABC transport system substrate-binding protein